MGILLNKYKIFFTCNVARKAGDPMVMFLL